MTTIKITTSDDAALARTIAMHLAAHIGMPLRDRYKLAIAVSELATNISRHGIRGQIKIDAITRGIEVLAEDEGPGLQDVKSALQDGYSRGQFLEADTKREGLGCGLGSICRMMDLVEFENIKTGGLRVKAWKWVVGGER